MLKVFYCLLLLAYISYMVTWAYELAFFLCSNLLLCLDPFETWVITVTSQEKGFTKILIVFIVRDGKNDA